MNYKTTSVKPVVAKIIRNTGKSFPTEYLESVLEWIPEAIKMLKTHTTVKPLTCEIEIEGHVGCLPCGLLGIKGIEYRGERLREGGDIRDLSKLDLSFFSGTGNSDIYETDTEDKNYDSEAYPNNSYVEEQRGQDIIHNDSVTFEPYYQLVPNYIQTSFEEGKITLYGTQLPVDEEGYPLIPDNENYRTAVYWYVLMMAIGSGYKHSIFNYTDCESRWEKYARRAINEVKYPNPDRLERILQSWVRLIPPKRFYEDFRIGGEQIQQIRGL